MTYSINTPKTVIAALVAAIGLSGAASAEGYSISNLGYMTSRDTCKLKAELALRRYLEADGGGEITVSEWTIYGWDLRPGDQDAVFMCPSLDAGGYQAILAVHGETTQDERIYTKDTLKRYWRE